MKVDIDEEYNEILNKLSKNDKFYEIKRFSIKTQRKNSSDSLERFNNNNKKRKKEKQNKKKITLIKYVECKEITSKNSKIKSIVNFDEDQANSIKSLAVEVKSNVAITIRFTKQKILMFANMFTSLKGFVYDTIDIFMYPVMLS